jgi:hypothetical protein
VTKRAAARDVFEASSDRERPVDELEQPAASPPPILVRAARGAVAGVVATAAMTAVRRGAQETGLMRTRPPHTELMRRLRAVRLRKPWGHEVERSATIAHYAFGAGAGALYSAVAPRRARPLPGVVYSVGIWASSYLTVLPWLHLMSPPKRDDTARQIVVAADHVVYGVVLDGTLALFERSGRR